MYYVTYSDSYSGANRSFQSETFDEALVDARNAWGHLMGDNFVHEANGITIRDATFTRVWPSGRTATEIFDAEIAQAARNAEIEQAERAAGWDPHP